VVRHAEFSPGVRLSVSVRPLKQKTPGGGGRIAVRLKRPAQSLAVCCCFSVYSGVAKLQRPAKIRALPKIRTRKSLLPFATSIGGGSWGMRAAPIAKGCIGGYGMTIETAPFFWGKANRFESLLLGSDKAAGNGGLFIGQRPLIPKRPAAASVRRALKRKRAPAIPTTTRRQAATEAISLGRPSPWVTYDPTAADCQSIAPPAFALSPLDGAGPRSSCRLWRYDYPYWVF
jgi:hypothetical protein